MDWPNSGQSVLDRERIRLRNRLYWRLVAIGRCEQLDAVKHRNRCEHKSEPVTTKRTGKQRIIGPWTKIRQFHLHQPMARCGVR